MNRQKNSVANKSTKPKNSLEAKNSDDSLTKHKALLPLQNSDIGSESSFRTASNVDESESQDYIGQANTDKPSMVASPIQEEILKNDVDGSITENMMNS